MREHIKAEQPVLYIDLEEWYAGSKKEECILSPGEVGTDDRPYVPLFHNLSSFPDMREAEMSLVSGILPGEKEYSYRMVFRFRDSEAMVRARETWKEHMERVKEVWESTPIKNRPMPELKSEAEYRREEGEMVNERIIPPGLTTKQYYDFDRIYTAQQIADIKNETKLQTLKDIILMFEGLEESLEKGMKK